jgi:hypothetical protein
VSVLVFATVEECWDSARFPCPICGANAGFYCNLGEVLEEAFDGYVHKSRLDMARTWIALQNLGDTFRKLTDADYP